MNYGAELMDKTLRFHPMVAADLTDATGWYDAISSELGNRFRESVNARLDVIASRAESFGLVDEHLRVTRLHGFPYFVVFEMLEQHVEVIGLFHSASDPEKWRGRK